MGYSSMMTSSEFVSDKSEAEIQMIFTEFKDIAEDYVVVNRLMANGRADTTMIRKWRSLFRR